MFTDTAHSLLVHHLHNSRSNSSHLTKTSSEARSHHHIPNIILTLTTKARLLQINSKVSLDSKVQEVRMAFPAAQVPFLATDSHHHLLLAMGCLSVDLHHPDMASRPNFRLDTAPHINNTQAHRLQ